LIGDEQMKCYGNLQSNMIVSSRLLLSKKIKKKNTSLCSNHGEFYQQVYEPLQKIWSNIHMTLISQKLVSLVVSFIDSAVCIKLEGILKSIT